MKVTIEFNLPDEEYEFENYLNASDYRAALHATYEYLRKLDKYDEKTHFPIADIRDEFHQIISGLEI